MEYDIDYVPSIFTHNTKSETSTTHSKLCRYKRLISRRSKALATKKKLSSKSKDNQLFVFDSSDVQQIIVINCDSVNGDTTQEQLMAIDCTDTGILDERSGVIQHLTTAMRISISVSLQMQLKISTNKMRLT